MKIITLRLCSHVKLFLYRLRGRNGLGERPGNISLSSKAGFKAAQGRNHNSNDWQVQMNFARNYLVNLSLPVAVRLNCFALPDRIVESAT
jgi:hypothetical protein